MPSYVGLGSDTLIDCKKTNELLEMSKCLKCPMVVLCSKRSLVLPIAF